MKIISETCRVHYIFTQQVSYKKQEPTCRVHLSSSQGNWWGPCLIFCVVLLCIFTFWVPCCDVHCDFRITTMFGVSLLPVVCRRAQSYLCCLCLFVYSGVQHILRCGFLCVFCLSSSCIPYVSSFLGLSFFLLPLRYSLTFTYNIWKILQCLLLTECII